MQLNTVIMCVKPFIYLNWLSDVISGIGKTMKSSERRD